jgi:uncharacterized membrane protein
MLFVRGDGVILVRLLSLLPFRRVIMWAKANVDGV